MQTYSLKYSRVGPSPAQERSPGYVLLSMNKLISDFVCAFKHLQMQLELGVT